MKAANEIYEEKQEYLETLDYLEKEAQGKEEIKSEVEEENKDIISQNSILNAKLTNVVFDNKELNNLNSCISIKPRIILSVNDSKFEKLK